MSKNIRKILALMMTLSLLLGMLPTAALAEMAEEIAAAAEIAAVSETKEEPAPEPTPEPTPAPTAEPKEEAAEDSGSDEETGVEGDVKEEPSEEPENQPTQSPIEEGEGDEGGDPGTDPTDEPTDPPADEPTSDPTTAPTAEPTEAPQTYLVLSGKDKITVGKSATLSGKNEAGKATKNSNLSWKSSDKTIATVKAGVVTAKSVGRVTITATAKSGRTGSLEIEVIPKATSAVLLIGGEELPAKHTRIANYTEEKSLQLSAKLLPEDASQSVSWKSSDTTIAKVSSDGKVTYKKPGTVTITATAKDGSKKAASITLKIRRFVTEITITGKEGLAIGKQTTLKKTVAPSNASVKGVKWESSNPEAAKITSEGVVTAREVAEPTEVTITASSKDGSGVVGTHIIWIHPAATGVQIQKDGEDAGKSLIMDLEGRPNVPLGAKVLEDDAYQGVSWKSSDSTIVGVKDGVLTAKKPGKATITATAKDGTGKKDTITVTVRRFVTNIAITGKEGLAAGKKTTLKAVVSPSKATLKTVKWESSNPEVASVTAEGIVTAKIVTEPTEVIITATAKDGSGIVGIHSICVYPAASSVMILSGGEDAGKSAIIDYTNNPSLTLASAVAPENAWQAVTWKSSDNNIATVTDGVISARKPGTVTITATAKDGSGEKDTIIVYVRRFVTGINITGGSGVIAPGSTRTLKATVTPTSATLKSVKWSSSDPSIARVSSTGVVTAATGLKRIMPVTITATAKDGSGVSASIEIRVGKDGKVYRALLIGNTYPGEDSYLPGPDNDLAGMKKMLSRNSKTDYAVTARENLTAGQIESAIYDTFEHADANDVSLFYYSGHGTSAGSLCGVGGSRVTVDDLRAYLDTVPGTKIVILDSCYSGKHINRSVSRSADGSETIIMEKQDPKDFNDAVVSAFSRSTYTRGNLATDNYVVLTACSEDEKSISMTFDGEYYIGAFTYALTMGGGWDMLEMANCTRYCDTMGNNNGKIELYEAYGFAAAYVESYITSTQNVQVWGDNENFVMWRYK